MVNVPAAHLALTAMQALLSLAAENVTPAWLEGEVRAFLSKNSGASDSGFLQKLTLAIGGGGADEL